MSSKRQKVNSKKSRRIEEPTHEKFVNEGVTKKFNFISKNRSFIKEKIFHHPEDIFSKTIANKGWRELCQPLRLAVTMVVREFYTNLVANVMKKVRVRGALVDFSASLPTSFIA